MSHNYDQDGMHDNRKGAIMHACIGGNQQLSNQI